MSFRIIRPRRRGFALAIRGLAATMLAVACVPWPRRSGEPVPRRSPSRDSLLQLDARRTDVTATGGVGAMLASHLAPGAVFLRGALPPVFGRENILAIIDTTTRTGHVLWQPIGGGLSSDGMAGYTFGAALRPALADRGPVIERYIAFWMRTRGEPWRIAAYVEVGPAPSGAARTVPAAASTPPATSRAALALTRADSDFAEVARRLGTAEAFGDAMAPDGLIFGGPELVFGPRAVRDYFQAQASGGSLVWRPIYGAIAASNDLGFTIGESVSTSRGPTGAAVQRFGKYLTVWRKQPNGEWKYVVDGGNLRPSPIGP